MAVGIQRWERRDGADRNEFALAALAYCKAVRTQRGVEDARFYWTGIDALAVLSTLSEPEAWSRPLTEGAAKATFALADLGHQTGSELWLDARDGQAAWEAAQA
ncbi:MAG TPA: hypothetical protein VLG28_16930 [Acidimicrobiia bacterium]|jgi:hypothetical protein|nr:hypothetical protein [Acidimicrobiia bacterium]